MENFIRKLPHDNDAFEKQWPNTFDELQKLINECRQKSTNISVVKVKILNSLIDYIIAEPITSSEPINAKIIFVEKILNFIADNPQPSLTDIGHGFLRILNLNNIFNQWHLVCLEKFRSEFQLFEQLSSTKTYSLIKSILESLQKHSFLKRQADKQTEKKWQEYLSTRLFASSHLNHNSLNNEETMIAMRSSFQQFFRYAVRMSHKSRVWSDVVTILSDTLPKLFDSYDNVSDAQIDLAACIESPVSSKFIGLLVNSYENNVTLFKNNFAQILNVIEKLLLLNNIEEASQFINRVVLQHFDTAVNIEMLLPMLIRVCPQVHVESRNKFCDQIFSYVSYKLGIVKCKKTLACQFFDLALRILNLCVIDAPRCVAYLLKKQDFYAWKELAPKFNELVQFCVAYEKIDKNSDQDKLYNLTDILRIAVDRANMHKVILVATHDPALKALLHWSLSMDGTHMKVWPVHVYQMAGLMLDLIDLQRITSNEFIQFLEALHKTIGETQDNEYDENIHPKKRLFFISLAEHLGKCIESLNTLPHEVHCRLVSFFLTALEYPIQYDDGGLSFEYLVTMILWNRIGQYLTNINDARLYTPCVKKLYSLACNDNEQKFYELWSNFWNHVSTKLPDLGIDHIQDILSDVLDQKQLAVVSMLPLLYTKTPEPYHARLKDIINGMFDSNVSLSLMLKNLFYVIVQNHPEMIKADELNSIFTSINTRTNTEQEVFFIFLGLCIVANAKPNLFDKYRNTLVDFIINKHYSSAFDCLQKYLVASTVIGGEAIAKESFTVLIDLLKTGSKISNDVRTKIFYACQLIGTINKHAYQSKRADLMHFNTYPECKILISFLDGSSSNEEQQAIINRVKEEIAQIEKRIISTEKDTIEIKVTIKQQEKNTNDLTARVDQTETHLNYVSEKTKTLTREVERIDAKTLSYVPSQWGHQVCQLLNVKAKNDWRLLGKRLGYSTNELRHWSMQTDPCMALINEWFMTHKADEAAYGLVKMLEEIDRQDVSKIIRDACTAAGERIPDDLTMDIKRVPPVFISYQWGAQELVMNLKKNLEEAGYACWMDTGEMGGGKELLSKIDTAIRGAKVILCCLNKAYAQSEQCLREVHLCINVGKPLIPLQLEKQTWPPEGALGPILSEYLYIRLYDSKSNIVNSWPSEKFRELLGQIRYHVAPDPKMITEKYRDWFVPHVENLIFLHPTKSRRKNEDLTIQSNIPLAVTNPQIMISYQWDHQTYVVALYKRLTLLNYRCWLDIFQMGGGDSLFEKIDDGIRNSKCVLSCVTPKYTKSINCRREVSLANALSKPIIPLLIEDTDPWPPQGTMGPIFADKKIIDFRRSNDDIQVNNDIWQRKKLKKLLKKLMKLIPEVSVDIHKECS